MKVKIVTTVQAALHTWRSDAALVVMPFTDGVRAARAAGLMAMRACAPGLLLAVEDDQREGFVSLVNRLFVRSASPLFGYVCEDVFAGRAWLRNALTHMGMRSAGLLAFNDGRTFGTLACSGLACRSWAQSLYGGPFFFPGYRGPYASTELSEIAAGQRSLLYAPDCVLLRLDGEKKTGAPHEPDRRLFLERRVQGFDGKIAVKTLSSTQRDTHGAQHLGSAVTPRRELNGVV